MPFNPTDKLKNLVLLRWIALGVWVLVFSSALLLMSDFPIHPASFILLGAYSLSNLLLIFLNRFLSSRRLDLVLLSVLFSDIFFLTLLLKLNGGAHNPFSILFLAVCGVGALLLSIHSLLFLIIAALVALAFVYFPLLPLSEHASHHHAESYPFHLQGMWLANSIGVFLIYGWIFYLRRINEKMIAHHERTQKILTDIERVDSMGRLFAQAAHQIHTPLGSLKLGLCELQDAKAPLSDSERQQWYDDMQKAVDQIAGITSRAGLSTPFSKDQTWMLDEWIEAEIEVWRQPRKASVLFEKTGSSIPIGEETAENLRTSLIALLDNAFEAQEKPDPQILVRLVCEGSFLVLSVCDQGEGMNEKTRAQALDPLFTTKSRGTGLGLYVCHRIVRQYEGSIDIDSSPGAGTSVVLRFQKDLL